MIWYDNKEDDPDWNGDDSFIVKEDGEWVQFSSQKDFCESYPNCEINDEGEVVKKNTKQA
tara:strand:- start:590 stop:769 length:180 start_codon:yes stop_codon:yes gene_type:complete